MTQATLDIELIVREVMRELGAPVEAAPCATAGLPSSAGPAPCAIAGLSSSVENSDGPAARATAGSPSSAENTAGQLVITQSPVTLAALAGRLDGVRQVLVPPGAVVTPAVYDDLYRRNVTLAFAAAEKASNVGTLRLTLVTAGKRFDPAALVTALRGAAIEIESSTTDCLMEASDRLAAAVAQENTLGALITRHTAAAVCLANRLSGVRAICVADPGKLSVAADAVGANVLVLDPQSGLFAMKRMLTEFCRDGVRPCPEVFRKRLG